jgi:glycosyltransferase involved in cell wall biosynthesis
VCSALSVNWEYKKLNPENTNPIRIVVIEPSGRLYGSEYCLLDILDGLNSEPFQWSVILPKGQGFDQLLLDRRIECHFLMPSNAAAKSRVCRTGHYLRILWHLRQLKPDLLYVNQTGSLRAAAMYSRWLKLPMVCQVQTLEDARWVSGRKELHKDVYAFICNSQFIANQTLVDKDKKCILYQGIGSERVERTQRFAMERLQRPISDATKFGILGRIAVSKGHYLLLDAMQRLGDRLAGSRVVVIGEGLTPSDTKAFQDAVARAGLTDRFIFRGYQTNIQEELSAVDVLLIPSIAEPLGRVLFDAAEFGVPVIISDAGGLGELGKRFSIGIPFKSQDPDALASAMAGVVQNLSSNQTAFARASLEMMQSLNMSSYLDSVKKIVFAGATRKQCAIAWLGDDSFHVSSTNSGVGTSS